VEDDLDGWIGEQLADRATAVSVREEIWSR
jgi:hypothetical protein